MTDVPKTTTPPTGDLETAIRDVCEQSGLCVFDIATALDSMARYY